MCKDKQTIHYCTILSDEQWIFLLEGKSSTLRQKCLHRLMTDAVRTKTSYKIKGIDIVLEVGQVAASDVELAECLGCNRKTIGKLIDCFNRLGMLTTRTNNRTSIHTLHFLTGWYVGGVLITNPHYVRPSATSKGLTGDVRTPVSGGSPSEGKRNAVLDNNRTTMQDTAWRHAQQSFLLPFVRLKIQISQPMGRKAATDNHSPIQMPITKPRYPIS